MFFGSGSFKLDNYTRYESPGSSSRESRPPRNTKEFVHFTRASESACVGRQTQEKTPRFSSARSLDDTYEAQKNELCFIRRMSSADERIAVGVEIINNAGGTLSPVAEGTRSPEVLRGAGQRTARNAVSMQGELLAPADNVLQRERDQEARRRQENYRRFVDKGANSACGCSLTIDGVGLGDLVSLSVADVNTRSAFMNRTDKERAHGQPQPLIQTGLDVGVGCSGCNSDACFCVQDRTRAQSDNKKGGSQKQSRNSGTAGSSIASKMKEESSVVVTNETVDLLRKDSNSTDAQKSDTSPSLRMKSLRRSTGTRKQSDGSKSASPSPGASPVLHCLNTSGSGTDDTASNGDDGSGDDDEDDGVYDETFRYSSYKYVGDGDVTDFKSASDDKTLDPKHADKHQDGRFGSSCSESILYNCVEKKNHQRSLSMTTPEVKRTGDIGSRLFSRRVIKRHGSTGTEIYQSQSEKVYDVERTLILQKPDSVSSYGFHLLGQNPMVVSTVEPGSAAEFGGVQVGDRLVTINGTNVTKAKESVVIDLILQSPCRIELGLANGSLSRDICICSGYLNVKPEGIMRNWKRRWCELKYDGFLYYYRTEECVNPLGAISLSNYVIIRGTDCSRNYMFKLVKYGQKTYYLQTQSEEDMSRWASHINMATSMARNTFCDAWLDISSHNVRLPALSIKSPDCHGFLTKIGNHKKNWRKRYCVLKTACLYYYKDQTSSIAKGVVHLHGYTIEEESVYHRRFGFMAVPPVPQMRTFHFTADNETGMQRWITALRSSIGKWVKVED